MLVGLKEVLQEGKKLGIGVGSFNATSLENAIAIISTAEKLNIPVIINHAQCHEYAAPIDYVGPMMVELAKRAKVKVCVHLDHGEDFDYVKRAIGLGFSSIMIDCSTLPYDENVSYTKMVTDYAHAHNVDVEAELGSMPAREDGGAIETGKPEDLYTKPDQVVDFVSKTNVDALAIAFGTAHGIYKVKPVLNVNIISEIVKRTSIPLVMHGGSGISDDDYREVIKRGISKINYYTYMSHAAFKAAKDFASKNDSAYYHDLSLVAREEMCRHLEKVMKVFSCK